MLAHSCLKRIRHISQHTRRRMILRIHSYKACGSWSIPSKLLVAILIRPAARLLCKPHTTARRLLAVFAGHETLLLEAAAGLAATLSTATGWKWRKRGRTLYLLTSNRKRSHKPLVIFENLLLRGRCGSCSGCRLTIRSHYSFLRIFTAFQPS
jgi:hypothetical protein